MFPNNIHLGQVVEVIEDTWTESSSVWLEEGTIMTLIGYDPRDNLVCVATEGYGYEWVQVRKLKQAIVEAV